MFDANKEYSMGHCLVSKKGEMRMRQKDGTYPKSQRSGTERSLDRGLRVWSDHHTKDYFIYCVCPKCGERLLHQLGQPCNRQRCPHCGIPMVQG